MFQGEKIARIKVWSRNMFKRGQSAGSRMRGRVGRCGLSGPMGVQIRVLAFLFSELGID